MDDVALGSTDGRPRPLNRKARRARKGVPHDPANPIYDRGERVLDPTDPAVLERQVRAYDARIAGYTFSQIAGMLDVDRRTVSLDVRMETRRRIEEGDPERAALVTVQADRYEKLMARSQAAMTKYEAQADAAWAAGKLQSAASLRSVIASERKTLLGIEKALCALLGLAVPTKTEPTTDIGEAMQTMITAWRNMTSAQRVGIRTDTLAAKVARMRTVLPSAPGQAMQ